MYTQVTIVIVSAVTALVVCLLTYLFAKKREHEAELRKLKLERYCALMEAINDIAENPQNGASFARATNHAYLVANSYVLSALREFINAARKSEMHRQNELFTTLVNAMRKELGLPQTEITETLEPLKGGIKPLKDGRKQDVPVPNYQWEEKS